MKKKILTILMTILTAIILAVTMGACGGDTSGDTHSGDVDFSTTTHSCEYNKQTVADKYKASGATCTSKATYYFSCECGEKGTKTFETGEPLGHAYGEWVSIGNGQHKKVCANDNSHTVTENCSGGTSTCTEKAVCKNCNTAYGNILNHNYGTPTYSWSGDKCTATRVCENDNNHKETETVTGEYVKDTDATCETAEKGHYVATFTNNAFVKQETLINSELKGEPLNHSYGTPTYSWSGDKCTATRVCANDNNHKETETVTGEYVKDTDATCETTEKGHYVATFINNAFVNQNSTEISIGNPLSHQYNECKHDEIQHWYECSCGAYETKENHIPGAEATETTDQKCTECGYVITQALGHVHTLHLTKVDAKPQSCTTTGNIEYYTCSCGKWFTDNTATTEITDKDSVVIEKDDHKYETLKKTDTEHWWECSCGAYETKENHKGGNATCQHKATCSVCDTVYGDFAEHEPKTAWVITDTHHYHECVYGCTEKLNYFEHSFTNYVSNKDATYESDGTKTAQCDGGCGKTHTVTDVGSILIKDEIRFTTLNVDGKNVYGKVSNATTEFVFYEEIFVSGNATYVVDNDKDCSSPISSKTVDLVVGDNTFYVLETVGNNVKLYTVTIHRREMFTVTFNTNGGTAVDCQIVEEDSFATAPITSKTGYTFSGWDYSFNTAITGNTTITASWNTIEYSIVYNLNGGSLSTTKNSYSIEQAVTFDNPTRDYYTFSGWYDNADFSRDAITDITVGTYGDIELYAKWAPIDYSITYALNGGTNDKNNPTKYNVETPTITLNNPTRDGYTFDGWYLESAFNTIVDSIEQGSYNNIKLYAKWTENINGLNFNGNGATSGEMQAIELKTGETKTIPLNTFVKTGYTFKGWSTSVNGEVVYTNGANYTMGTASQYTIYAVWEANLNTLTFNGNGATGGSTSSMQIRTDATTTLNVNGFTKLGYHFVGWSEVANGEVVYNNGETYIMGTNSQYTLYAVWEANLNTLTFNGNGATSGSTSYMQIKTDATVTLNLNGFTRTGYHFIGWAESKNGEIVYNNGASYAMGTNSSYTLYAVWEANLNNIYFNGNGATSGQIAPIEACTGETITLPSNVYYLSDDYTFGGWAISETGSIKYSDGATYVIGAETEQTLYACWKQQTKDGLSWSLSNNEVTITDCLTSVTNIVIPSTIANYTVTRIGNSAFEDCSSLTSVVIGDSVTSIGNSAFEDCSSLTSVVIGDSVTSIGNYAFEFCSSLTSIEIPNSVTRIGNSAFYGCKSLTSVTIGNSVKSIGSSAFYGCRSLTSVTIGNSVKSIGYSAFDYCESLTKVNYLGTIDQWAQISFSDYRSNPLSYAKNLYISGELITDVKLTTATKISHYAFFGCSSLTSIEIPNSVTSIGDSAFRGCSLLTSIEIPNSVTNIGDDAFYYCPSLTSVTIGNSVKSIGEDAFYDCSSLTSVNYLGTIDSWTSIKFGGYFSNPLYYANNLYINGVLQTEITINAEKINSYAFYNCDSLTSVTIGNSVTSIGDYAFYNCDSLTSVVIGDSVTSIDENVFRGCSSLQEITLPFVGASKTANNGYDQVFGYIFGYTTDTRSNTISGTTYQYYNSSTSSSYKYYHYYIPISLKTVIITGGSIGDSVFNNCSSLTSVIIGNSVTSIDYNAFEYCRSLTSVVIGDSVTSIGEQAFYYCDSLTSVTIGDSVTSIGEYAFSKCSSLTSVVIGDSVTSIGEQAFSWCSSLTSVVIGDSVTSIDYEVFEGCSSLTKVNYLGTIDEWTQISFSDYRSNPLYYAKNLYINGVLQTEITINAEKINSYAFYNCDSLTSVTIGNSVTSIGDYAFYNCDSLTSVTIGNSVTSIGKDAFADCSSLTSITIPNSVTSIGSYAFSTITSLTIYCEAESQPNSWIGEWNEMNHPVVWDCNNNDVATDGYIYTVVGGLKYGIKDGVATVVKQPETITTAVITSSITYKGNNYNVTSIRAEVFEDCSSLTSVVIGDSVTRIGNSAFYNCSSLKSVTFGKNSELESVGDYAFYGCSSLTSIEIPNSVTSIGESVFKFCSSLTSVVIGNSVTSIGRSAFSNCYSLTSVIISNSVKSIGNYAFADCRSLNIIYYGGTQSDWAKISIGGFSNSSLTSATRYYYIENESDLPADNGNYWHYVDGVPTVWTKTEE